MTVDSSSLYSGDSCQVTGMKGAQKAAGTYSAEAAALDNANYQLPDGKTVAFTIEKAAVTIQADDAGKHIEEADPKLTYRITEGTLAEGDSLKGITVSREKGETAGAYKLWQVWQQAQRVRIPIMRLQFLTKQEPLPSGITIRRRYPRLRQRPPVQRKVPQRSEAAPCAKR